MEKKTDLNSAFLTAIQTSFNRFIESKTSRSTAKLKPLHGRIAEDLATKLGEGYKIWAQGLLFFSLGATFTILKWDVTKLFKPYAIYGIIGACFFYWAQLTNLMYAALIVTIISLTTYSIERRQQQGLTPKLIPNILTDSSFFIYAAHTLPQGIILWSLKLEWLPITGATSVLIVYFLSPVILTTVCLLSFILLRRISPISLYFLTGGRQ